MRGDPNYLLTGMILQVGAHFVVWGLNLGQRMENQGPTKMKGKTIQPFETIILKPTT